ncbi:MAG TPA: iron ABC transporter permease [Anaerolineae bacterium]|nr:iron ABC transporter permease [Anaerolineae bacterium]
MPDNTAHRSPSIHDESRVATRHPPLVTRHWLLVFPLLFLLVFYFYPLGAIFRASLMGDGGLTFEALLARLLGPATWRTLGFTFGQAALSTGLTLLLGLPGAYVFARYDFPGKRLLNALTTVPFVLPTVVVATAFTAVLGPKSPLNVVLMNVLGLSRPPLDLRYTLGAILLAHVFYNDTLVLRIVGGFWANLDPRLEQAARTLGASPWRAFVEVTLPLLLPALGAAALLVFIFCFTSFGVILILGGPRFATLEVAIYRQAIDMGNFPLAAGLSLVQILCTLGLTVLYTRLQGRLARPLDWRPRRVTQRRPRTAGDFALVLANVGISGVLLGLPLATLVVRSFDAGLRYYTALFENPRGSIFYVPPVAAVGNSVKFAVGTTALALLLGMLTATALYRRRQGWIVDALFMLPLGTSAVTLGLGYLLAMARPPLNLRGTPALIVCGHTLVALPFVVRNVLPALQALRPSLREAAATLGATPARVFVEVDLPIVWRALTVGGVFAFTVSMGEFGATSMIARPELPTIPIAIYRFLSQAGALNYGQALAMSTLLMAVCVAGFVAIESLRPPGSEE